jgi:hypothetical protein
MISAEAYSGDINGNVTTIGAYGRFWMEDITTNTVYSSRR